MEEQANNEWRSFLYSGKYGEVVTPGVLVHGELYADEGLSVCAEEEGELPGEEQLPLVVHGDAVEVALLEHHVELLGLHVAGEIGI